MTLLLSWDDDGRGSVVDVCELRDEDILNKGQENHLRFMKRIS